MDIDRIDPTFLHNMQELLGGEYTDYLHALADEPSKGLRANTLKVDKSTLRTLLGNYEKDSPLCVDGLLCNEGIGYGKHPYHHAGLYYMQDPSAMSAVEAGKQYIGQRVLDMCAAPGGKSTQLAAAMQGKGILVCNEVVFQRAKILRSNIERLGIRNALVVSNQPSDLENLLSGYFDTVVVDAPCSGEGMLRKEPEAALNWSEKNVQACAKRQYEILLSADKTLCKGGTLIYSTCTLNKHENEEVIFKFLKERDYITLPPNPDLRSVTREGYDGLNDAVRIFPQDGIGEGHFVCVMKKQGGKIECPTKFISPYSDAKGYGFESMYGELTEEKLFGDVRLFGKSIYVLPEQLPIVKGLNVLYAGVEGATLENKRIIPHNALIHTLDASKMRAKIDFSAQSEEIRRYLKGEEVPAHADFKGYGSICADGYSLGLVKSVSGVLKNHYPKGLRQ